MRPGKFRFTFPAVLLLACCGLSLGDTSETSAQSPKPSRVGTGTGNTWSDKRTWTPPPTDPSDAGRTGSVGSPRAPRATSVRTANFQGHALRLPPPHPEPDIRVDAFFGAISMPEGEIDLVVGQGRTVTLRKQIATDRGIGIVALGDPTIADFQVLPNPRFLRLIGRRAGTTDLTIITADDELLTLRLNVRYDLDLVYARITHAFPDSQVTISQMRESIVLEGQVRSNSQAAQIQQIVEAWLATQQPQSSSGGTGGGVGGGARGGLGGEIPSGYADDELPRPADDEDFDQPGDAASDPDMTGDSGPRSGQFAGFDSGSAGSSRARVRAGEVINLLRVPGTQQVLLQVRVAELNRTGLREIGADWLFASDSGNLVGTAIGGAIVNAEATGGPGGLLGAAGNSLGPSATAFGIFPTANFDIMLRALRRNSLLTILAEPNLVAMSGHEATFLAGGEFPIPVQSGVNQQVSIEFKDFGVQLRFIPTILDENSVRLLVAPEVSTIDQSLGTTIVPGGIPTPGINTRRVQTTVEMRQGETLALAGLLTVTLDAQTTRIPGLGDLPYIGPFFGNTTHEKVEKELLVLVTPHLITSVPGELPLPGQCIASPNDAEFYLLGRLEGRTGQPVDPTMGWEDHYGFVEKLNLDRQCVHGPVGFSQ